MWPGQSVTAAGSESVARKPTGSRSGAASPTPRAIRRRLDDALAPFLGSLIDGTLSPPGWKLTGWDVEQGICLTYESRTACILVEFEARNESLGCYARTDRFNICARRQLEDRPLSQTDRELVDAVVAAVREREGVLPTGERPEGGAKTMVREILVDRLLMPEGGRQYYINPYVGCMIACPFCYVIDRADFSRRLEGLPELPWGRFLDVKVNAAEVLRRETRLLRSGIVRLSPILTDPYQPAERRYRITRQCLEVLAATDLAPVVLTRAPRIVEDLELFKRFRRALVGFSIPTDADEYRRIFEPRADPIEARLAALRAFHAAGVRTFAVIQPVLPMNADRLVEKIAPFVTVVRLDRMYLGERVRHLYRKHGLDAFATEAYAEETIDRLARAFRARGVAVDPLDRLEPLLG